ncbi:MAG: hypothetical protein U1E76_22725 [Planctomycetota bacterium]
MRFELLAAYCVGVLLPVAEVCRRRTDFSNIPAYVDDFLIGGILVFAAWSVAKGRRAGRVLLAVAWAAFCGGMYYSFFGQLAGEGHRDTSGWSSWLVVGVKGALFLVGIFALVRSAQAAVRAARDPLP